MEAICNFLRLKMYLIVLSKWFNVKKAEKVQRQNKSFF